ncbi:alpha/beta hydrolase [Nocardioides rotundus]|uniref:alpha/beta hydrolase n=1 Tax=Nocardioides rotundus TaxID=1774216 RepID=UPI001CBCA7EE|nr:alpha/beta hydrolase [Nocardioides rotundus]UAL29396.1 alpha/beta hydrolase [Nocardioides rotundus]
MPSRRHQALAAVIPRLRRSRELDDEAAERRRVERWHARLTPGMPTPPRFRRRFSVRVEELTAASGETFPAYVITRRGSTPRRTILYLHGGGFMAPMDVTHARYAGRLASALDARVVLPAYPLAPEHTWRDSHATLVELAERCGASDELILAGDSAGGGLALAIALGLRDRGRVTPAKLLLISPWVDLSTSTPETPDYDAIDTWLFLGKLRAYAGWWAGSADDLDRPEVSPALADLSGLPPALMFCGTRDLLVPGCRLLARRAAEAGWPLRYVEEEGLIHVYPLLPLIPEARRAWRTTVEFLR